MASATWTRECVSSASFQGSVPCLQILILVWVSSIQRLQTHESGKMGKQEQNYRSFQDSRPVPKSLFKDISSGCFQRGMPRSSCSSSSSSKMSERSIPTSRSGFTGSTVVISLPSSPSFFFKLLSNTHCDETSSQPPNLFLSLSFLSCTRD